MSTHKKKRYSIGIRELSNRTSSVIKRVQASKDVVTITNKAEPVAQIIPFAEDSINRLFASGLVGKRAKKSISSLQLEDLGLDSRAGVKAVLSDR